MIRDCAEAGYGKAARVLMPLGYSASDNYTLATLKVRPLSLSLRRSLGRSSRDRVARRARRRISEKDVMMTASLNRNRNRNLNRNRNRNLNRNRNRRKRDSSPSPPPPPVVTSAAPLARRSTASRRVASCRVVSCRRRRRRRRVARRALAGRAVHAAAAPRAAARAHARVQVDRRGRSRNDDEMTWWHVRMTRVSKWIGEAGRGMTTR